MSRNLIFTCCLLVVLAAASFTTFFVAAQTNTAVQNILREREDSLANIVKKAEQLELQRCGRLASWSVASQGCNVASCGNKFPESDGFKCTKGYGNDFDTCGSHCEGKIASVNKSTILFAPNTLFTDANLQGFLAYGKDMDTSFERERDRAKGWMGMGHYTGGSRWFPGTPRTRGSSCTTYDPRIRGWYIGASTGPKDIVIVVDVSGSMGTRDCTSCQSRLQLMQTAVKALLDTLTFNDYFAVVSFQSSGSIVTNGGSAGLLQATTANIKAAKTAVDSMYAYGGTYFTGGFQKAFQIFGATSEGTSNCQRMIMFLTDGVASDATTVGNYIAGQQAALGSRNATIFTYSMSSGASNTVPREIACANGGVEASIQNGANPLNAMKGYYKYLAHNLNSTKPRWTEVYTDAFGAGRLTTVARAVYDRADGSAVFVGVAEIDVPVAELTKYVTEAQLISQLVTYSGECPSYNISHCYLQVLRSEAGYECPSGQTAAQCRSTNSVDEVVSCTSGVSGGVNSMLCDPLDVNTMVSTSGAKPSDEVICCDCGLAPGAIAGIVIGSVVGVALIGGGIFFLVGGSAAAAGGAGAAGAGTASAAAASSSAGASGGTGFVAQPASYPPQPGFHAQAPPPQPQMGYGQPQYAGQPGAQPSGYPGQQPAPYPSQPNMYGGSNI